MKKHHELLWKITLAVLGNKFPVIYTFVAWGRSRRIFSNNPYLIFCSQSTPAARKIKDCLRSLTSWLQCLSRLPGPDWFLLFYFFHIQVPFLPLSKFRLVSESPKGLVTKQMYLLCKWGSSPRIYMFNYPQKISVQTKITCCHIWH